ncbi:Kunitz/Bovine pancreatic trypsin inhibitor domain protein [Cooperia oncophora]
MLLFVAALARLALCDDDATWYSSRISSPRGGSRTLIKRAADVDLCQMPPDSGTCSRELIRYYYDPKEGDCKRFTYS